MKKLHWQQVGKVNVDSGTIMIGDPGYYIHPDHKKEFHQEFGKSWAEFCEKYDTTKPVNIGEGTAVVTGAFGGDGEFPVSVLMDQDGMVKALKITFPERR